jgi:hypothetical protein
MGTQYTPLYLRLHTYIQSRTYTPNCIIVVASLLGYISRLENKISLHYLLSFKSYLTHKSV